MAALAQRRARRPTIALVRRPTRETCASTRAAASTALPERRRLLCYRHSVSLLLLCLLQRLLRHQLPVHIGDDGVQLQGLRRPVLSVRQGQLAVHARAHLSRSEHHRLLRRLLRNLLFFGLDNAKETALNKQNLFLNSTRSHDKAYSFTEFLNKTE